MSRLDQRMIEDGVLFASGHEREACYIGEHSPGAILAKDMQQGACLWELVRREVTRDRRERLSQLLPISTVAAVAKQTEPLITVSLTDDRTCPDDLSAFAPFVARSTDLI